MRQQAEFSGFQAPDAVIFPVIPDVRSGQPVGVCALMMADSAGCHYRFFHDVQGEPDGVKNRRHSSGRHFAADHQRMRRKRYIQSCRCVLRSSRRACAATVQQGLARLKEQGGHHAQEKPQWTCPSSASLGGPELQRQRAEHQPL